MDMVPKPAGVPSTWGTAKLPAAVTKTSAAAPSRSGIRSSGRVTVRSAVQPPAPAARAARSRAGSARAVSPAVTAR